METKYEVATFAGGCFWCMVKPFDSLPGIKCVTSGYTGGYTKKPTYKEVTSGISGHAEAVQILFAPKIFSYEKLLEVYWQHTDPTDAMGQFADRGSSYRPAIYYHTEQQRKAAEISKRRLNDSGIFDKPIVVEILPAEAFYPAEESHQDFYKKEPQHYQRYYQGSGREEFIDNHWKIIA